MKLIHQAMLIMAQQSEGWLCRPSEIAARGGNEDVSLNTTANLHSAMIAQNYYNVDLLISTRERSPHVRIMHQYNYDAYDPTRNRFWDDTFEADLHRVSHVSFAHMFMFGERHGRHWRADADSTIPVFGHRGPKDGVDDPNSYATEERGRWHGVVIQADNARIHRDDMSPWLQVGDGDDRRDDHIFGLDDGIFGADVLLTFTESIGESSATYQHD